MSTQVQWSFIIEGTLVSMTQDIKSVHLPVSMPSMMHVPQLACSDDDTNSAAIVLTKDRHALVLMVDVGGGASIANAVDMLIPFVIKKALVRLKVPHKNSRFFTLDAEGQILEVVIDQYDGHWDCDAHAVAGRVAPLNLAAFSQFAERIGFPITEAANDHIANAVGLSHARRAAH